MRAPIWIAKEAYEAGECEFSWRESLNAHMAQGYCISRPDYFIMARPVVKDAPEQLILDCNHVFDVQRCNCWHVWMAAGDALPSLWTQTPHEFEWTSYQSLKSKGYAIKYRSLERLRSWEKGKSNQRQKQHH
jgi:hypothetical protein